MQKAYNRIYWENYPERGTPLNEANLNKIDAGVDELDNRVITLDTTKASKEEVSVLFSEITFNESSGVLTFTRKNGGTVKIDTKLEKLAVNFSYDATNERLVITLDDGTVQYVDMKALITQYNFTESDTIVLTVNSAGNVSGRIKNGSITGEMLEPNYLANVTVQAQSASASASAASASAASAKDDADRAEDAAGRAEAIAGFTIDTALDANSSNPIANKAVAKEFAKYLPLTGGKIEGITTVEADNWIPIRVVNTGSNTSTAQFKGTGGVLGYLGFSNTNNPVFADSNGTNTKKLIHEGNVSNYALPKTGGKISGNFEIVTDSSYGRNVKVSNNLRSMSMGVTSAGVIYLQDDTNGNNVLKSTVDGTNTFNGTASGNLKLDGGGEVSKSGYSVITLKNKSDGATSAFTGYKAGETLLGYLGFGSANTPSYRTAEGKDNALLHTGNSAKVHIGPDTPSDTSSAWLDTSE